MMDLLRRETSFVNWPMEKRFNGPGKDGAWVICTGARLPSEEFLILISPDSASQEQVVGDYKKQWEIETLCKSLKSQGFDFEDTHMTDRERLNKLITFLASAFLWAHITGEWRHEQKPIIIKRHTSAKPSASFDMGWTT